MESVANLMLRLIGIGLILSSGMALADPPTAEEVFTLQGVSGQQIGELAQGQAIAYPLRAGSADELSAGIALYLPVPLSKLIHRLQPGDIKVDVDVITYGILSSHAGAHGLGDWAVTAEEAQALLEFVPGDEFNLSAQEIDGFQALKRTQGKKLADLAGQYYREILFRRFEAYRLGGVGAIATYAREETLDSSPALELRQAANESKLLAQYFPALSKAWLDYPATLPPGMAEHFMWVRKTVENEPTAILRHVVSTHWNTGLLIVTREFYVEHSYNSSQWITLCLPYRNGTVLFQEVRSFSDQVTGLGGDVKHLIGQEVLKNKMLKTWERFRAGGVEQP